MIERLNVFNKPISIWTNERKDTTTISYKLDDKKIIMMQIDRPLNEISLAEAIGVMSVMHADGSFPTYEEHLAMTHKTESDTIIPTQSELSMIALEFCKEQNLI